MASPTPAHPPFHYPPSYRLPSPGSSAPLFFCQAGTPTISAQTWSFLVESASPSSSSARYRAGNGARDGGGERGESPAALLRGSQWSRQFPRRCCCLFGSRRRRSSLASDSQNFPEAALGLEAGPERLFPCARRFAASYSHFPNGRARSWPPASGSSPSMRVFPPFTPLANYSPAR